MPRKLWWDNLRAVDRFKRLQPRCDARLRLIARRATFEQLEDRIVLTVALRPGPVADEVIVSPSASAGTLDVTLGPAIVGGALAEDAGPPIVDLTGEADVDRRYAIPATSDGLLFRVDPSKSYTLTAAGHPRVGELQQGLFGYQSYDVDRHLIEPIHVEKFAFAADTTLAQALHPGDASFLIADASGWSNALTESAETRSLAWYGYTDSTGFTYPAYSYTRNVASDLDDGLWAPGGIWYDTSAGAYRVVLNQPWAGPAIAAGTAIRNATAGPPLSEPFPESLVNLPERWQQLAVTIGGEWQNGQRDDHAFRPGTAYVQPTSALTPALWNELAFGPAGDFPGSTSTIAGPTGDGRVTLDLDVLAKQVDSFTGDYNHDGTVDAADYTIWRDHSGSLNAVPYSGADSNGDGKVDPGDYQTWRSNFGAAVSIEIQSVSAARGTASIAAGPTGNVIHYQSEPWFIGTDITNYTLRDAGTGATYTSHIVIDSEGSNFAQDSATAALLEAQGQLGAGNLPPKILQDPYYNVAEGEVLTEGRLLDPFTDAGDKLVVRLLSGTTHGALRLNYDGTFAYSPSEGFIGTDTFRYEAFDGLNTTTATATIDVLSLPDLVDRRLREIGLGMLNYNSSIKRFPITSNSAYFDENGLPLLSWRVHLLPYLGLNSLYSQFHLDEPWDSPNNLPLLDQMPNAFRSPGDLAGSTTTRMQTFTGPDAPFGNRDVGSDQIGPKLSEFTDGSAHTILVVQSAADAAVVWTKPDDLAFDVNDPLAGLGTIGADDVHAVMADGATITLPSSIDAATFKALVTHRGGEIVDADTLRREYLESNAATESNQLYVLNRESTYLKQLALAALSYADAKGRFPIVGSAYFDDQGQPYLSWRVHLLPYLGYNNLYARFHLDEPWDSPNNLPLLAEMPDPFRSVGDASNSTSTRIQTFTGPKAPFGYLADGIDQVGPSLAQIADGTSNTILFAEAAADHAVPWTKPDDLEFDVNDPLLGIDTSQGIHVAFFDGHQETLRADISAADFSALVTRNGREVVKSSQLSSDTSPFKSLSQRKNDLKQISLGMLNYSDNVKRFPGNRVDAAGTPLLSWRVLILPYIEQGSLYSQFHLNEPWDSPHNLSLLQYMPDIFRSSGDAIDSSTTSLMYFTGPGAPFPAPTDSDQRGPTLASITDGLSNTIAVVEAGPEVAVPWTKPVDLPLDMNNPFSVLGELGEEFLAAYFDGHIESLSSLLSPGQLKARLTRSGGEILSEPNEIVTNPGFHVLQSGGVTSTNELGVDTFYVVLDRKPVGQVVIDLATSDPLVAALDQTRLTFTAANWDVPQRVAFRGVDNHVANPDQAVDVTLSIVAALSDADFQPVPAQMFSATVSDDEPKVPALMGDYNHDGSVNAADYTVWRDNLGKEHQFPYSGADGNGDGAVAPGDYQTWRENFGSTSSGAASITAPVAENLSLAAAEYLPIASPAQPSLAAKPIIHLISRSAASHDDLLLLAIDSMAVKPSTTTEKHQAIDAALADDTDDAPCDSLLATFGVLR